MISLSDSEQQTLTSLFKKHASDQPYQVLVFGSRAMGKARKYSDVDIALIGQHPVSFDVLASLNEALEDSDLPYMVDVVDFQQASEQLRSQITQNGVELVKL